MLCLVTYEWRTIDTRKQISTMQWQPTFLAIKFWIFTEFYYRFDRLQLKQEHIKIGWKRSLAPNLPWGNKTLAMKVRGIMKVRWPRLSFAWILERSLKSCWKLDKLQYSSLQISKICPNCYRKFAAVIDSYTLQEAKLRKSRHSNWIVSQQRV